MSPVCVTFLLRLSSSSWLLFLALLLLLLPRGSYSPPATPAPQSRTQLVGPPLGRRRNVVVPGAERVEERKGKKGGKGKHPVMVRDKNGRMRGARGTRDLLSGEP